MSTTTSNMSLTIPSVGDSTYPTSVSSSLTLVDAHDHTGGKGVQIPTGGIEALAVTTAKIANDAVDKTKIAADVAGSGLGQNVDGSLEVNVDASTIEINSDALRVKDAGITQAKLAARSTGTTVSAGGIAISNSCGSFATGSTSFTDVTNLSVTITTTGRPVMVALMHDQGGVQSSLKVTRTSGGSDAQAQIKILRDASPAYITVLDSNQAGASNTFPSLNVPISSVWHLDTVAAGTYTYKMQVKLDTLTSTVTIDNSKLYAWEI